MIKFKKEKSTFNLNKKVMMYVLKKRYLLLYEKHLNNENYEDRDKNATKLN